ISGTVCLNSPSDFPTTSVVIPEFPVTLAPGRARLATSPAPTGSPTLTKTMGIVLVAFLAASEACVTTETMTSTSSWTNSSADALSPPQLPSGNWRSVTVVAPLDNPSASKPRLDYVLVGNGLGAARPGPQETDRGALPDGRAPRASGPGNRRTANKGDELAPM